MSALMLEKFKRNLLERYWDILGWIFTVKLTKPWTPDIYMKCYCVARNKPLRREITRPQKAAVISLWFSALVACPELYCYWPVPRAIMSNNGSCQYTINTPEIFSGVHGFLSLTVMVRNTLKMHNLDVRFWNAISPHSSFNLFKNVCERSWR